MEFQIKNTAILRDWKLLFDFTAKEEFYRLSGRIYDDSRNYFLDGTFVETSKLKNIDFANKKAETENTIYELKTMDR